MAIRSRQVSGLVTEHHGPLPAIQRPLFDLHAHSVMLDRAHHRHGLRVPLKEHLLLMAPRTLKPALLADVILTYRTT